MKYLEHRKQQILSLGFSEMQWPALVAYVEFLWKSNEDLNLVSRKMTIEELVDNHVIDCLLPLSLFPKDAKLIADFGSGGGLPAVLYAIQFPDRKFSLFEKSPKKQEFLTGCLRWASNMTIKADILPSFSGYDLVMARGFKPVDVILDMSRNYYQSGGKYFLLKARLEKIEGEIQEAKKKFKMIQTKVTPLKSSVLEVERHLVQINVN